MDNCVPYALHTEHSRDLIRMIEASWTEEEINNFEEAAGTAAATTAVYKTYSVSDKTE